MSPALVLACLFVIFGAVSFFTMLHLMGTTHTRSARTLRTVHRVSEVLALIVFIIITAREVLDFMRSGFTLHSIVMLTFAAVLIPLLMIKNLISERYPELRNRLISIGTTVLVFVLVFSAASAMLDYHETRQGAGGGEWTAAGEQMDLALGKELFATRCSKCHRLDVPLSEEHTPEEWRAVVESMRRKDPAWISEPEAEAIAGFLIHVGSFKR